MDTDQNQIEKQPKIAVMLVVFRKVNDKQEILIQERTKEPYFGYKGFLTGKIRFWEKVIETAKRELKEETGLECDKFVIKRLVHNFVRLDLTGELLEDKMFYIVVAINPSGKLIDTRSGKNYWITEDEFKNLDKKYYDEDQILSYAKEKTYLNLEEETFFVKEFEYTCIF